jgi:hypothetical protein
MVCSKKSRIVISLIVTCMGVSLWGAEPNETQISLKFETNNQKSQLWIRRRPNEPGRGPIKPTHVAVLYIQRPNQGFPNSQGDVMKMLDTPSGKSLSKRQREFLTASDALGWWGIEDIQNHDMVLLYAVSEEDAKKTARAYLESVTERIIAVRQRDEKQLNETIAQISEIEKELPEKKKQAKEAESKYREIKNARYFSLDDGEAYDRAKETMLQMDKMLDTLEIELAGIREKMSVINEYRKTPQDAQAIERHRQLPEGMLVKLEQMFVEQTIELKSAEARKLMALKIRDRDKAFLDLFNQWQSLEIEGKSLLKTVSDAKTEKVRIEGRLANPRPEMMPPVVYQNRVTIYPVLTK